MEILLELTSNKLLVASRFKNHESSRIKDKDFRTNSDIKDNSSEIKLRGRLLASFQDDAKYEHVGQDTRSQGGKDDQDKQGKDLKISDIKTKSKDNEKGSRSKITKHEGTSLQRRQRQRSQELNDKSNLIDLMKECHNELTSGEIVSLKILMKVILGSDITPSCFVATIPARGNQGGGSDPSVAKDSRGKAIMDDAINTPTRSASRSQVFTEDNVVVGSYETVVDQFPTPGEMVRIESSIDERLAGKMSVLHCLMMSYRGELLARYRGLLKSNREYVQSVDSRLRSLQRKLTSFQGIESQVSGFEEAASRLASDLNQAQRSDAQKGDQIVAAHGYLGDVYALIKGYKHSLAEKDAKILRLKSYPPEFASFFSRVAFRARLARPAAIPAPTTVGVSLPFIKELTITPDPFFMELFSKDSPPSSTATSD
ncbi:hypothetical protein Tco_1364255 [Tanacetum coccineum]